jgi:lipoprotein-releasing system permease protein
MEWYSYLALKQLFPTGRKVSFFSIVSILGVSIGVMVLFVVQSVMDGFQHNIRTAIVETQGDVCIESDRMMYYTSAIGKILAKFPEIEAVAKYAYGVSMLKCGGHAAFPLVKGIDLENEIKVVALKKFTKLGSLESFDSDSIMISSDLARQICATVGSNVEIYSPNMLVDTDADEFILPKTLKVTAIYEFDCRNADRNIAIISIDTMQELYDLGDGVHGLSLKLYPGIRAEKLAFELNRQFVRPMRAISWQEMNKDLLFALKMEKTMMLFVLFFILLIVAFSIAGSLVISVVRKTREIGLIGALGGTRIQCAMCFMLQGMVIGIIGGVVGISCGMLVLRFRNDIVAIFVKLCGVEDFMLKFYSFAAMPAKYGIRDIFSIFTFALAVCCVAGIFPAIKVAKINPAEALRNE